MAFNFVNMPIKWEGEGLSEIGYDKTGKKIVEVDPIYFRPSEVEDLLGDSTKAKTTLGWKPKYTFEMMIKEMIDYEYEEIKK